MDDGLKISREEARRIIEAKIKEGQDVLSDQGQESPSVQQELLSSVADDAHRLARRNAAKKGMLIWKNSTEQALRHCFTDTWEAHKFGQCFSRSLPNSRRTGSPLESAISHLEALMGRLPLIGESEDAEYAENEVFKHTEGYTSVNLRGQQCTLTSRQAEVIQLLHEAYRNGTPEMHQEEIKAKLSMGDSARLKDRFRSDPDAWKCLITQGQKKGTLRLNI